MKSPEPLPREIPTWVRGWTYIIEHKGKITKRKDSPTVKDSTARAIFKRKERPGHLEVASCGCTLYPDVALQCAGCIERQSPEACRAMIAQHEADLKVFEASMGFESKCLNGRDFMINPHNGYYGKRDEMVMLTEKA